MAASCWAMPIATRQVTISGRTRATGAFLRRSTKFSRRPAVSASSGWVLVASYGRPGDTFVFYEISPRVVDVARSEFTFLRDTPAQASVVLGDGRLSLEREPPRGYDVLGIDAFSGDSIPMHLVTREAMAQYVRHLAPDGVIVFQATNRYIDLLPVVKRLASEFGMEAVLVSDVPSGSEVNATYWLSATDQILVSRRQTLFESDALRYVSTPIVDRPDLATFTDAHHNMFRILK